MSDFETRNLATVLRQITKYGADVVVTRAGTKTYDVATGGYVETGGTVENAKAVISDFVARVDRLGGLNIQSGDKQILFAASGFARPKIGDTISFLSDTYTIVPVVDGGLEVQTVLAQNTPVLYKVHGRRK